ncbi:DHHC zinc finger domain protein [Oesophagostomum dentatum]|uniref:Palmitoyltransferase n=1 Tax=Oesophagostomum dentatum TaxID=61180 RepID=A0A0B1TDB7_OESDE|nr:DHHC zinc finger domain protein [Oesophagostomum dentatum]
MFRLLELGADPNVVGGLLVSSPLHWAARVGHSNSAALLVKAGAVANVRDTQGYTPIHLAVQTNQSTLVAYLLEKFEYCKDITDNSGMTPVMWAAYRTFGMFPIRLLVRAGANLNAQEHLSGNTALHIAAQERNYSSVKELLAGNADLFLRNKQQETAIDIARNMRNHKLISMLEDAMKTRSGNSASCAPCSKIPLNNVKRYVGFITPGLVLALIALLFHLFHYLIVGAILLVAFIAFQCLSRFDFHTATHSLVPIGICIAEPSCMIITWCVSLQYFVSWWLQIAFVIVMCVLFWSLFKIVFSNPGIIEPSDSSRAQFAEMLEHCERVNYCFTYLIRCSCVMDFDHHCPWLHQCITIRNLRTFLVFIACVAISAGLFCYACGHLIYLRINASGSSTKLLTLADEVLESSSWLLFCLALAFFHAIMLSALFINQCVQISENLTTMDRIRRSRGHHYTSINQELVDDPVEPAITFSTRLRNVFDFCIGTF